MKYTNVPPNVRSLEQRMRNATVPGVELVNRRRVAMALVVVGQMLPAGAVKGGSAMALRYGRETRFTQDLDAARFESLEQFRDDFQQLLSAGWGGFTGRLIERAAPRPAGIPKSYVMKPFDVKLDYLGRSWCTVKFELGHNEIGDATDPEFVLADDLADLFVDLGLQGPEPIPVLQAHHQIAQKLHAVSGPGSERAHDLVDLQLLDRHEDLNWEQVSSTCIRLFSYRGQHEWPPIITSGQHWPELYRAAAEDIEVLHTVEEAVFWVNSFIQRIGAASQN